jgi:hypothetical protein
MHEEGFVSLLEGVDRSGRLTAAGSECENCDSSCDCDCVSCVNECHSCDCDCDESECHTER